MGLTQAAYEQGNMARARQCIADAVKNGLTEGEEGHIAAWNAHFDELVQLESPTEHAMDAIEAMEALGIKPSLEVMYRTFPWSSTM